MSVRPGRGAAPQDTVRDRVYSLPKRFRRESVNGLVAQWELRVGSQTFAISVTDHACMVADGPSPAPETIVTTEPETWLAIDEGRITGGQAFLEKRLVLQGNLDLAVRMQTLFRPYRRARHLSDLDQVEVVADGLRISTYIQGKGDPLLLLHGLGGTKITWFPLLPELAERHRLIVPDLPGHGESEKPREDYTPRFYARVLRHLMDEVGVDKAAVIGNSLGGRITLELALRSPSRVSSLILLDPSVPGLRWRYVFGFTRVFPTELGAVPFMVRERWMRAIIRRLFAHPEVLSDEAFAAGASEFIRIYQDPAARMAFFSSLRHILTEPPEQFFGTLRRIKQPTLVVFGDNDRLVPPRLGVRLAQHLPNSTFMVLPGVGHVPQFEATRETLDAIDGFLASQAPPRRRRSTAP
jgi:pimeloyl-ACP methyl ester carboxylesterase/putative sterol carrier protein